MIRVRLVEDTRGVEVWAEGHAGFSSAGQDIVCAGVSALLFGALTYLREYTHGCTHDGAARVDFAQGAGYLWFRTRYFYDGCDRVTLALLSAGLRLIAQAYPGHVAVCFFRGGNFLEEVPPGPPSRTLLAFSGSWEGENNSFVRYEPLMWGSCPTATLWKELKKRMEETMEMRLEEGVADGEADVAPEVAVETPEVAPPVAEPAEQREPIDPSELAALRELYPHADPVADMADPLFCGLLSGDVKPTLRQVYELCHHDDLTAAAVSKAVSTAVADAVSAALAEAIPAAVAEAEANLMEDIRLRGARPSENGVGAPGAVESHPSVDRLTRSERAALAYRAERGERIRL